MSRVWALHRVEPISREGDPGQGLAAPVHDPLWGLARQRQFGELAGEDTGSPVQAAARMQVHPLDSWRPAGTGRLRPFDPDRQVLEAVVAGESATPVVHPDPGVDVPGVTWPVYGLRDRIDAGRRLAAALPKGLVADLRRAFPIEVPADGPRLARRAAALLPDGMRVAEKVLASGRATDPRLATTLGTTATRVKANRAALEEHADWCGTTYGLGPGTWVARRLERRFDLGSHGRAVLTAPAHTRESVDALDLDATPATADLRARAGARWLRRIPTRLRFPGMPNERFWEFEDAQLSLARIDAATHDLARLALVEFSSTYGNDWFTFPVPVDHGSVATVPEIVVRDTFGRHELIRVADPGHWSMFVPDGPDGAVARLVVPATTVAPLTGPVAEEVRFVRDENANLVWAVESIVTDDLGVTRDLVADYTAHASGTPEHPPDAELLYRLMTDVPDHWVPFVPVRMDETDRPGLDTLEERARAVGLVEATLPRRGTWGVAIPSAPRSSILRDLRGEKLPEEEVGPAGVTVRRRWYLARSADGGRHVWVSRSVTPGRGEGASGLAFDVALDVRERPDG